MEWSAETWEEEGTAELVLQQNVGRLEVSLGEGDESEQSVSLATKGNVGYYYLKQTRPIYQVTSIIALYMY